MNELIISIDHGPLFTLIDGLELYLILIPLMYAAKYVIIVIV